MGRFAALLLGSALIGVFWTAPASPQSEAEVRELRKEVEALKQGQAAIMKELQELRTLMRAMRQRPAGNAPVIDALMSLEGVRFVGDARAPVTLMEFSDYQCPFCARHFRDTMPQLERDYIKTGKLKYVVRDFPLVKLHPQAFQAHESARCAGDQGKHWEMHTRLFADPSALGRADLESHAQALGLDLPRFRECLAGGKHAAAVRHEMNEGQKVGVTGTPAFLLGITDPADATVRITRILTGAQPYERFKNTIEALLEQASTQRK